MGNFVGVGRAGAVGCCGLAVGGRAIVGSDGGGAGFRVVGVVVVAVVGMRRTDVVAVLVAGVVVVPVVNGGVVSTDVVVVVPVVVVVVPTGVVVSIDEGLAERVLVAGSWVGPPKGCTV
ncbi:hypothetical protein [Nocardia araoensis]|uniref:hypothetical protein n=1 Tax=Nocardia araoensis TaxID=228600 RepID=UPI0012F6D2A6|nr:hypothetical protein [Nocardia araoensis]